jgi:uncharacterized protein
MIRLNVVAGLFGVAFGFLFAAGGFNQYDVIHGMLLLQNPEPYFVMASSMLISLPTLWWLERRRWRTPLAGPISLRRWPIERNKVYGGLVFGTGWAITGACPGTAATMVGAGSLLGFVLAAGILTGIAARDVAAGSIALSRNEPAPDAVVS